MAHIGLALHFESLMDEGRERLNAANFIRRVTHHQVASRNTASAFLNEMLKYGVINQRPHPTDRRMRIMAPADTTIEAFAGWIGLHFMSLDALDGGGRLSWFQDAPPETIALLQPAIAMGLLHDQTTRDPHQAFAHFMWMNSGFLVTERLIVALSDHDAEGSTLPLALTSIAELTEGINLSRSHAARKVNEAEGRGILGWSGTKGRSPMWVSKAFVSSFLDIQAAKLAIIDGALRACGGLQPARGELAEGG